MQPDNPNKRCFDAMENLLTTMHHRQDTKPLANKIHSNFASGRSMFMASRHLWEQMGFSRNDALFFSLLKDIVRYDRRTSYGPHANMRTLREASDYLAANFFALSAERFYLYCINQRGNLKERILLNQGIADTALFDLRSLLKEVVRTRPLGGVVLAHNHPGGTRRPSPDDIECTLEAMNALTSLEAPLLDHVIVANGVVVSLRHNGFIPESRWIAQNPKHRILNHWLDGADDDF